MSTMQSTNAGNNENDTGVDAPESKPVVIDLSEQEQTPENNSDVSKTGGRGSTAGWGAGTD